MTQIAWDATGEKFYAAGVDRGVLYVDTQPGVPWNGLIAVTEKPNGAAPTPYYVDGVNYLTAVSAETFNATLEAFYSPPEFDACDGLLDIAQGISLAQQARKLFGLSYRTLIGNDVDGSEHGYKIHLVYNALAAPSSIANASDNTSVNPANLSWDLSTTPVIVNGFKASAHLIIDSTEVDPSVLQTLEATLYGSDYTTASLPSPADILNIIANPILPLFITPNTTTGLATMTKNTLVYDVVGQQQNGIYVAGLASRLIESSTPGLYTLST